MAINSFTETTNKLVEQVNIALSSMQKLNDSLTTQDDTVTITVQGSDPVTGDPCTYTYSIPSYNYTLAELHRMSSSVDTFIKGEGVILLDDGTYRQVTTMPVAKSPKKIVDVTPPSRFRTKPNWFFESLMFPSIFVRFNLKDKIDDRSDRIVVKRVIFDNFNDFETQWFKNIFVGKIHSYIDVLNILNENNKKYWEDEETKNLPLSTRKYTGEFTILDKGTIEGNEWFYLNTINYGLVTDGETIKNIELNVGDKLRFKDSLFKVKEIEITEKRVRLTPLVGTGKPTINQKFDIYSKPFEDKHVDIEIGYNECQVIFLRGVNDDFNIISDEWSESIPFYSNDLTLVNSSTTLSNYYHNHVADFGKIMEGEAKEKFIPAYYGVIPNAPTITADQFKVHQINKQLNASLDTESIKNTQTQIESTKTIVDSLRTTIAQQGAELVELTDPAQRADLQAKIENNISQMSKKIVEYQSLVRSLSTLAYENEAVSGSPKYRVRGFFEIPEGLRLTEDESEPPQEIIQFEIAYRYLRLDNTGNPLDTYSYIDPLTGQVIEGTFTDWQIVESNIKRREFDEELDRYVWLDENVEDGDAVNINQVDIPIVKGEKVQFKVRSISEAGWPNNPMKSRWSDTVIIDFPTNLEGSDQVVNILEDAKAEETSIKLDETLNAAGVYTHLQDGIPNPNVADGTYFKHQSRFLAYNLQKKDIENAVYEERTVDLQSQLSNITTRTYVTLSNPGVPGYEQLTGTLQQLLQVIIDNDPSIYNAFRDKILSI